MLKSSDLPDTKIVGSRIEAIDLARGIALLAMAHFHFTYDLGMFGIIDPGTAMQPGWKFYAECIASSFLILVGVSMVLANGDRTYKQINWASWGKRLAMIVGGAALISITTWYQNPNTFVFFGILHEIAFATVAGLLFLRAPWWACFAVGIFVLEAKTWFQTPALDSPVFWWSGLQEIVPVSVDYVPVFPWFAMVLFGMALAKLPASGIFLNWLKQYRLDQAPLRLIKLFGRHSLLFYLVHQPILFGGIYLYFMLSGGN